LVENDSSEISAPGHGRRSLEIDDASLGTYRDLRVAEAIPRLPRT
jgi:hypothetical protein